MMAFTSRSILLWEVTVDLGSYPAMYVKVALTHLKDVASSTIAVIEATLGALLWLLCLRIVPVVVRRTLICCARCT